MELTWIHHTVSIAEEICKEAEDHIPTISAELESICNVLNQSDYEKYRDRFRNCIQSAITGLGLIEAITNNTLVSLDSVRSSLFGKPLLLLNCIYSVHFRQLMLSVNVMLGFWTFDCTLCITV